jgi:hypothetical protein
MSATETKGATAATSGTIDDFFHEAMRSYEKRIEEFVETFYCTSNQTIDLFEKTLGVYQARSVPDAQRRVQDLIDSSLSTLRVNIHSALNTNAKIIASWKELVVRFGPVGKNRDYTNNTPTIYSLHRSHKDIARRLWLKQKRTA